MRQCAQCGNELQLLEGKAAPGVQGDLRVEFLGLLIPSCPSHGPQPEGSSIGLPLELLMHVVREKALPLADRRGLLRKRFHCRSCRAPLDTSLLMPGRVESRFSWRDSPSLTLAVEGSVARCPQCGTAQLLLDPRGVRDVSQALMESLKNLGLM